MKENNLSICLFSIQTKEKKKNIELRYEIIPLNATPTLNHLNQAKYFIYQILSLQFMQVNMLELTIFNKLFMLKEYFILAGFNKTNLSVFRVML